MTEELLECSRWTQDLQNAQGFVIIWAGREVPRLQVGDVALNVTYGGSCDLPVPPVIVVATATEQEYLDQCDQFELEVSPSRNGLAGFHFYKVIAE